MYETLVVSLIMCTDNALLFVLVSDDLDNGSLIRRIKTDADTKNELEILQTNSIDGSPIGACSLFV